MNGIVQIAAYPNMEEALVAQGFLRSNDIDASLTDTHTAAALSSNSGILGGNRLFVPSRQAAQARTLLRNVADDETSPDVSPACRACGTTEFRRQKRSSIMSVIFGLSARMECVACRTPAMRED